MAVIQTTFYSAARNGNVDFTAILPMDNHVTPESGYHKGPFKTVYLLHGMSGNQLDWLARTRIEHFAMDMGYAVIMPGGQNRFYVDSKALNEKHGEFIGRELVEFTRKMYHLSHKREDTILAGLSMGGYGAIRNGLKYSKTFGAIIALSSALITGEVAQLKPNQSNAVADYSYYHTLFGDLSKLPGSDNDPKALAKKALKGQPPRLYLSCGTEDFLYPQNLDYHHYLSSLGYAHTYVEKPGAHTWEYWNEEILAGLKWLQE